MEEELELVVEEVVVVLVLLVSLVVVEVEGSSSPRALTVMSVLELPIPLLRRRSIRAFCAAVKAFCVLNDSTLLGPNFC